MRQETTPVIFLNNLWQFASNNNKKETESEEIRHLKVNNNELDLGLLLVTWQCFVRWSASIVKTTTSFDSFFTDYSCSRYFLFFLIDEGLRLKQQKVLPRVTSLTLSSECMWAPKMKLASSVQHVAWLWPDSYEVTYCTCVKVMSGPEWALFVCTSLAVFCIMTWPFYP